MRCFLSGLVEAIDKGVKLTHKQERKANRLFKLQKGEITAGKKENEVRDARQVSSARQSRKCLCGFTAHEGKERRSCEEGEAK